MASDSGLSRTEMDVAEMVDDFTLPGHPEHVRSGQGYFLIWFAMIAVLLCVGLGQQVRLEIEGIPLEALKSRLSKCGYLTVFSLLPHENKLSVLHFNCQRLTPGQGSSESSNAVIKSKDTLLLHVMHSILFKKSVHQSLLCWFCMSIDRISFVFRSPHLQRSEFELWQAQIFPISSGFSSFYNFNWMNIIW